MSSLDQQFAAEELVAQHTEGLTGAGFLGSAKLTMASEILPGLWVGGCKDGTPLPYDFGFVLSLYPWEKYQLGPATDRLQVRLFDTRELPDEKLLFALARVVNNQREERKVLVHCQAGLNRSSLITALALVQGGMCPSDAIGLIRRQRSVDCLFNQTFEQFVRGSWGK